jgi:hypothetical protein
VREHRSRRKLTATGAVLLAVACGGGGGADDGDGGYGPAERADFVAACSAAGGVSDAVCGCFYDRLAETLPHERFEELDEQIRDDPSSVPAEVADLAITCGAVDAGSAGD